MKPLFAAAALLLASVATAPSASAQAAAGTLPNPFDRPAAAARPPAQAAPVATVPSAPPAPALVPALAPANPLSEDTLRTLITGAQAGAMDYTLMSDDLAAQVRAQEAGITPLLQRFGAVQGMDFMGDLNGADRFAVNFTNAATEWVIGFNDAGKVAALVFRPAQQP